MKKVGLLAAAPIAAVFAIVAAPTAAFAAASVTVTPASGVTDGQSVTVSGTGFKANASLVIVECSAPASQAACDTTNLGSATANAAGTFSATFKVKSGTIGNGSCTTTCYIAAAEPADTTDAGIATFVFGSAAATTTPSTAPTAVPAGSGGGADRNGVPVLAIVLASVGGLALLGGAAKLARR